MKKEPTGRSLNTSSTPTDTSQCQRQLPRLLSSYPQGARNETEPRFIDRSPELLAQSPEPRAVTPQEENLKDLLQSNPRRAKHKTARQVRLKNTCPPRMERWRPSLKVT